MSWRLKAIQMVQTGGYSQKELAEACGVNPGTMLGWLDRASLVYPIYSDPGGHVGRSGARYYYMLPFHYDVVEYERIRVTKGEGGEPNAKQRAAIRTKSYRGG